MTNEQMEYHIFFEASRPIVFNDNLCPHAPEKDDWTDEELVEYEDLMRDTFTCDSMEELEQTFNEYVEQMEETGHCSFKLIFAKRIYCEDMNGNVFTDLEWEL